MITARDVREGVRVRLLLPQGTGQRGMILSNRVVNGTVIVDLDKEFRDRYEYDTGIREVPLEQLEIIHGS